jgi:hypothetical protein
MMPHSPAYIITCRKNMMGEPRATRGREYVRGPEMPTAGSAGLECACVRVVMDAG